MKKGYLRQKDELTRKERLRLLEARYARLLLLLQENPSDEALSREVRHTEVDIVRLTGEKTIDY